MLATGVHAGLARQPLGSSRAATPRTSTDLGEDDEDLAQDDDTLADLVGQDHAAAMRSDDVLVAGAARAGLDPKELLDMQVWPCAQTRTNRHALQIFYVEGMVCRGMLCWAS